MLFLGPEVSTNLRFMSAGQVKMSLIEDDQVLVMFASLRVKCNVVANDIPVMCEFPEDICDLSLE